MVHDFLNRKNGGMASLQDLINEAEQLKQKSSSGSNTDSKPDEDDLRGRNEHSKSESKPILEY